jgi:Na+/H+ antiporter NhaA
VLANSSSGSAHTSFWQIKLAGMSLEHWVNDGLMAVFFLLIGLELERALYKGDLATPSKALLPVVAAVGGMVAPALIHYALNAGSETQIGFGIPMATDIAFALGVFTLLGPRVPAALKIFVLAFAVIDDLGAPLGVTVFCIGAIALGVCELPPELKRVHLLGAGMLGGIGFTMAIFITNLAFGPSQEIVNSSKVAILLASLTSAILGFLWLLAMGRRSAS